MKQILLALLFTSLSSFVSADYLAYSVSSSGKIPLPKNLDLVEVESLVNLEWGEYRGPKGRVGILPVENNSGGSTSTVLSGSNSVRYDVKNGRGVPVEGIEAILMNTMNATGRFRLLERTVLDQALKEQDLGASGRISQPSAAKIGKLLGAEYLLQAVVTNYERGVKQSSNALGGLVSGVVGGNAGALLGGIGIKKQRGVIGMNFRLIDAETSEIVFSNQSEVTLTNKGVTFAGSAVVSSGAMGDFISSYSQTPIGKAVIAACNKGVFELAKQIGSKSASGTIIKASPGKIFVNLGAGSVSKGETLVVLKKGEDLIDPDTGLSLGGEMERVSRIRIHNVHEKYSIGEEENFDVSRISRGDVVQSMNTATGLKFAEKWTSSKKLKKKFNKESLRNLFKKKPKD